LGGTLSDTASLAADRAKHPDVVKAWQEVGKMLGGARAEVG